MTPEDLDKVADLLRAEWGKSPSLWELDKKSPLFMQAQNLLANPNAMGGAFIWEDMAELIRDNNIGWSWTYFGQYNNLKHGGVITEGANNVREVLKRLARKPRINLGDYL